MSRRTLITAPPMRLLARHTAQALAALVSLHPLLSLADVAAQLDAVVVTGGVVQLPAAESAPSQGSLTARSAQSLVSEAAIRDYTSPVADYTQVMAMTPGVFSYNPNGVGLGDAKVTLRGLSDSFTTFSFDGIPFNDTNGVSHHSWVFFPSQFIGGAVVDRSPGGAATIGQATFNGTVDLKSRMLSPGRRASVEVSHGTWNTNLFGAEYDTGNFGTTGESNLLFNAQKMKSDGYETYNKQDRYAFSTKYQYLISPDTTLTLFGSYLDLQTNTPNIKGISRADYNRGVYTNLLSSDPDRFNYFGYNFYNVQTNFFYAGLASNLGGGWKLEDKVYHYGYHNQQNYANTTKGADPTLVVDGSTGNVFTGIDKLNSYATTGNLLRLSQESNWGTLRTGVWLDRADSYRYQVPQNPKTLVDVAVPNFNETYITTTIQPYVEFEFKVSDQLKVTPGVKYATYQQSFNHLQDNGGAVGTLGGTAVKTRGVVTSITGGAPNLLNSVEYTDTLPSLDVHYLIEPNWSVYGQYAIGDQIPSTSVFDVKNAQVSPFPKATRAYTTQVGTVYTSTDWTFAADIYQTRLDGAYAASPTADANGNFAYALAGNEISKGIEAEANVALGHGFSLYGNATFGSVKYTEGGQWVAGAPSDTETLSLNWQQDAWSCNLAANRVGRIYNDGKNTAGTLHEALEISPVVLTNLFINYTVKNPGWFSKQAKLQLAVNNLFDRHDIVAIANATSGSTTATPAAADLLTVLPARSVNLTATFDF